MSDFAATDAEFSSEKVKAREKRLLEQYRGEDKKARTTREKRGVIAPKKGTITAIRKMEGIGEGAQ